jgi:hypothetical protein
VRATTKATVVFQGLFRRLIRALASRIVDANAGQVRIAGWLWRDYHCQRPAAISQRLAFTQVWRSEVYSREDNEQQRDTTDEPVLCVEACV